MNPCKTTRKAGHGKQRAPLWAAAGVGLASAMLAAGLAEAEGQPYYMGASQSFGHESNLLRLNDAATTPAGLSRADTLSSTALFAGIDQPISRQRLHGDLALRSNRYAKNDVYNNDSYTARLGWDWETVNRLSGTLSASASRSLASFNVQEVGLLRQKNLEDSSSIDGTVRLGVVTQYTLVATAGHREVKNSLGLDAVQARNFQQDSASLGLRWQPRSALTLGVALRGTQGRYPKFRNLGNGSFEADRFKRQDVDLTANWAPSGPSKLDLRLSTGKTDYDLATQRNFSGVTGALTWRWQATGKVRLTTTLARDTGQDSYAVSVLQAPATVDYSRVNTSLRLTGDWAATSKIAVNASVAHTDRQVVRSLPVGLGNLSDSGRDRVQSLSLGARWAPTRSVLVGCNVGTDRTRGNGSLAATHINNNSVSCYGQFTLN